MRVHGWRRFAAAPYAVVGFGMATGIAILAYLAPLTYDESFTTTHYRAFGALKTLVTYDYPNNHVPFTALVAALPASLVHWNPWSIRIVSVAFGVAMIAVAMMVARRRRVVPFVPLLLIGGSPALIVYSFLARGYTFSAVWLLAGALVTTALPDKDPFIRMWGACVAGALVAVGTWPLPTTLFAVPGWIVALALVVGIRAAIAGTATFAVVYGVMVAPLLAGIRSAATGPWNGNKHFWHWVSGAVTVTNVVAPCFFAALVLTVVVLIVRGPRPTLAGVQALSGTERLALVTGALALSWYILTGAAYGVGLVQLPFARTSVPALWLLIVSFVAIFPRRRLLGWAVIALLLPGFILSAIAWSRAAAEGHWPGLPALAGENVLAEALPSSVRSIAGTGATAISCTWYSEYGCDLIAPRLESEGVKVTPLGPQEPWLPQCIVGSAHPSYAWQITIFKGQQPVGIPCY
jgi:hypothetical protein